MTPTPAVLVLGVSQLVGWGLTYYAVGVFGEHIAADTGWRRELVYGGFSVALVVMGLASPAVGRRIDRGSGRTVMVAGTIASAIGCLAVARAVEPIGYLTAWMVLGLAMRMTLYDAAFATLVRSAEREPGLAMAQITLFGGLASTVFWPLGNWLAARFGWRGALDVYAAIALAMVPLLLTLPDAPAEADRPAAPLAAAAGPGPGERTTAVLFAAITALGQFLNAAMSSHMIGLLVGAGLAEGAAVAVATLRGVGQSASRLAGIGLARRASPATLQVGAAALVVAGFVAALGAGRSFAAAAFFAIAFGAGNGLSTIVRGTLPLVLFPAHGYGVRTGWLLAPSFAAAAVAPLVYAVVIERLGPRQALALSAGLAAGALAGAGGLLVALRRYNRLGP
jgi:MFS family permease